MFPNFFSSLHKSRRRRHPLPRSIAVACCNVVATRAAAMMPNDVDRPTAVANALAAAVVDTFEEGHPGPALLQHQNTARNRVRRDVKQDRWRNAWLQRLYDGSFFIAMKVFEAVGRNVDRVRPTFCSPIRPYNGGELTTDAVSHLLADISCALCIMFCGVCDALCACCERSQLSQPPEADM